MDYVTEAVKTGIKVGIKLGSNVELSMWDYSTSSWVSHSAHPSLKEAVKSAEAILSGDF